MFRDIYNLDQKQWDRLDLNLESFRRLYCLRTIKGNEQPRDWIFFDVESHLEPDPNQEGKTLHIPYLVCACHWRQDTENEIWEDFTNMGDFWEWVVSIKTSKTVLCAHNITYDLVASRGFENLLREGFALDNFFDKARVFIMEFVRPQGKTKRRLLLLNSGNFYQGSLAELAQSFGLEKLEIDFQTATAESALEYCRQDVRIVKVAMQSWLRMLKEDDLGNFTKTVAGQAFTAFRHRFMSHDIVIHGYTEINQLEREGYHGGRVECWRIGKLKGSYYILDVNGMYPYVMKEYNYPRKLDTYRIASKFTPIRDDVVDHGLESGYLVMAKVKVQVDDVFPFIPLRHEDKIIFPTGEFTTTLTTPELILARQQGIPMQIEAMAVYHGEKIFHDYVDYFHGKRKMAQFRSDKERDLLYKLFLNSLYGKFGQKSSGWKYTGTTERSGSGYENIYLVEEDKWVGYRWFHGTTWKTVDPFEAYHSFPAIPAHVTAYARLHLYHLCQLAGPEEVIYMDTDSMFVSEIGYQKLLQAGKIGSELGQLKVEGTAKNPTIHCPKDYEFGDKVRHKGIPARAVAVEGKKNRWELEIFPKIATFIRENSLNQYFTLTIEKELKRNYTKGKVDETGKVTPLRFPQG